MAGVLSSNNMNRMGYCAMGYPGGNSDYCLWCPQMRTYEDHGRTMYLCRREACFGTRLGILLGVRNKWVLAAMALSLSTGAMIGYLVVLYHWLFV